MSTGEPWWVEYATEPVSDDVLTFGAVALNGRVLRPARDTRHAALVAVGPARIAVPGATAETNFAGFVHHEGHGGGEGDGIGDYEVECTGVVKAVHGIAYRREPRRLDEGDGWVPVAQEPPVECTSTTDRDFDTYVVTIEFTAGAAATAR